MLSVDERRRDVSAIGHVAPRNRVGRFAALRKRDVAARTRTNRIDGPYWRITAGDKHQTVTGHRRADGDFGIWTERPEKFAGRCIVSADFRTVGNNLMTS